MKNNAGKSYLAFHFSSRNVTERMKANTMPVIEFVESRVRSAYGKIKR